MIFVSSSFKSRHLFALPLLVLIVCVDLSYADNAPDSINVISTLLPDSVSTNGKIVYVDFWASWCAPCRHSFPWMQDLIYKYRIKGLEIIAVSVDKDHKAALKFLNENNTTFPVIFDSTGSLAERYGLDAIPSSFIYGRDGTLLARHAGFLPEEADSLDDIIFQLLGKGETK